jgi:hypothetical protein
MLDRSAEIRAIRSRPAVVVTALCYSCTRDGRIATAATSALAAQADLFASLTAHPALVGTGRENALADLLRQFMPRRFEILGGTVAVVDDDQRPIRSMHQLDMIIADTMDFPTLLRAGNAAVVVSQSVRGIIEVKSNLTRGAAFISALVQIARARQLLRSDDPIFAGLFSFGAPTQPETLRDWLSDVVALRELLATGRGDASVTRIRDALLEGEATGLDREDSLLEILHNNNLPNIIAADHGAVARKATKHGPRVFYTFLGGTSDTPSVMVLVDEFIEQLAATTTTPVREAMAVVRAHFSLEAPAAPALEDLKLSRSYLRGKAR